MFYAKTLANMSVFQRGLKSFFANVSDVDTLQPKNLIMFLSRCSYDDVTVLRRDGRGKWFTRVLNWNSRTRELSFPGTFVPRNFRFLKLSFLRTFVFWNFRSQHQNQRGTFVPYNTYYQAYTVHNFDALTADIMRFINVFRHTYLLQASMVQHCRLSVVRPSV